MMRIRNDWCQMIKASPSPRAWLGKGWIGSLSAAGWSANAGCSFGSILTNPVFFARRYTGGPQTTRIILDRHRSGLRTLTSGRGGLKLPFAELQIFAISRIVVFLNHFFGPQSSRKNKNQEKLKKKTEKNHVLCIPLRDGSLK